jgi:hypothetical protein
MYNKSILIYFDKNNPEWYTKYKDTL